MSRRDWSSRTEDQAAASARADAYEQDDRDHDDGVVIQLTHPCDEMSFPDDCLGCMTWERYWAKERALVDEANDAEWWA